MQNLEMQIKQIAGEVNVLKGQGGNRLPSQGSGPPEYKPINAIRLRSGREVGSHDEEEELVVPRKQDEETSSSACKHDEAQEEIGKEEEPVQEKEQGKNEEKEIAQEKEKKRAPFPTRLAVNSRKDELDKDILEVFKKVEVNIPIIDAIRMHPPYAKFFKNLCTNKRKLKGNRDDKPTLCNEHQHASRTKRERPWSFRHSVHHWSSTTREVHARLGASINVMPRSVYETLGLGDLKDTRVMVQLADRSTAAVLGVAEDVLVKVNGLVFPADFYILEMGDNADSSAILLGRPFLRTARTCIDCHSGTMSMEFDNEKITFNIFDTIKYPNDYNVSSITIIDEIDEMVEEHLEEEYSKGYDAIFEDVWGEIEQTNEKQEIEQEHNEEIKFISGSPSRQTPNIARTH